jgi:hypothetical protein
VIGGYQHFENLFYAYAMGKPLPLEMVIKARGTGGAQKIASFIKEWIEREEFEVPRTHPFQKFIVEPKDDNSEYSFKDKELLEYAKEINANAEARIKQAKDYFGINIVQHARKMQDYRNAINTHFNNTYGAESRQDDVRTRTFVKLADIAESDVTLISTDLLEDLQKRLNGRNPGFESPRLERLQNIVSREMRARQN